ncbi:adenylate/guanylate cyclase domain-containing protein [Nocardioides jejuensis]|uniref:Adenylate/guanylate cyclase domain-containing protein n=1 Tax=Nocardioides jejuensis TaxID=2502782 RepID=A0A4R1BVN5_9ACTN|nr:adenylate/guanylate cyclase domain-containing protein [Nocardioides jejuensis]TCJ22060.1 adenylate/guanylate cyclase domain-containing protein [Nocardioides jejuensis]
MARAPRRRAIRFVIAVLLTITNLGGAAVVFALAAFVVPLPGGDETRVRLLNLAVLAAYVPTAVVLGTFWGVRRQKRLDTWLVEQRPATDREKSRLLKTPQAYAWMHMTLWGFASALFGIINIPSNVGRAALVVVIVAITGITVASLSFLIVERRIRPITRAALETGLPAKHKAGHVSVRVTMAWLLGTGAAASGLMLAGLTAIVLGADATSYAQLGATMISLGAVIILVGGLVTFLAARATADPIRALRAGFARVGRGKLNTWVAIDDGTEIGELQAGFNEMVAGLREREQLRDLFGRHVGVDVAREALANGVQLGGEVRDVTVLFVDVMGSTTMATELDPTEVVGLLNRFFDVVIDVVHEYDGWINKFEGDAALAIWGAPMAVEERDAQALAAARVLAERLRREVPEIAAGVGVSGGPVVCGNVGSSDRYEYTVIGDAVNEAARLTSVAKEHPERCVANAALLAAAASEQPRWVEREAVVLRGRGMPTRVAVPRT